MQVLYLFDGKTDIGTHLLYVFVVYMRAVPLVVIVIKHKYSET